MFREEVGSLRIPDIPDGVARNVQTVEQLGHIGSRSSLGDIASPLVLGVAPKAGPQGENHPFAEAARGNGDLAFAFFASHPFSNDLDILSGGLHP